MCDPMTLIAGVASIAAPLLAPKPPKPPKVEIPASPAATARAGGATVRIGTGAADDTTHTTGPAAAQFVEKRKAGTALGNLGRSGLTI